MWKNCWWEQGFFQFQIDHIKSEDIKETKDKDHRYYVIQSTANCGYVKEKVINEGEMKIAINISSSYDNILITTDAVGGLIAWLPIKKQKRKAKTLKNYFT